VFWAIHQGRKLPVWFYVTCLTFFGIGALLETVWQHEKSTMKPQCSGCRKDMTLIETVPSDEECEQRGFTKGRSGHAYTILPGEGVGHPAEIRKQWYGCAKCRRYFLLDNSATTPIPSIDKREAGILKTQQVTKELSDKKIIARK